MTIIKLGPNIEIDIDVDDVRDHNTKELLLHILAELKHQKQNIRQIMIAQTVFDTSLKALTDAVANVTSGAPSTPDSVVQAYITGVDTNTAHLLAGSATPPPPTNVISLSSESAHR